MFLYVIFDVSTSLSIRVYTYRYATEGKLICVSHTTEYTYEVDIREHPGQSTYPNVAGCTSRLAIKL